MKAQKLIENSYDKSILIKPYKPFRLLTPNPTSNHTRLKSLPSISYQNRNTHRTPSPSFKTNVKTMVGQTYRESKHRVKEGPLVTCKILVPVYVNDFRLAAPRNDLVKGNDEKYKPVILPNYEENLQVKSFLRVARSMKGHKRRFAEILKFCIRHFKALNISFDDIELLPGIVGKEAFARKNSVNFIRACKEGNIKMVMMYLQSDK